MNMRDVKEQPKTSLFNKIIMKQTPKTSKKIVTQAYSALICYGWTVTCEFGEAKIFKKRK